MSDNQAFFMSVRRDQFFAHVIGVKETNNRMYLFMYVAIQKNVHLIASLDFFPPLYIYRHVNKQNKYSEFKILCSCQCVYHLKCTP